MLRALELPTAIIEQSRNRRRFHGARAPTDGGQWWHRSITGRWTRVPVGELLAWRVVAGLPILCLLLWGTGRMRECWAILRQPRVLGILSISAVLIAINWIVFVWSVVDNRLSEASLGYYICPLFIVALGMVVLGERMRLAAVGRRAMCSNRCCRTCVENRRCALDITDACGLIWLVRTDSQAS